MADKESGSKPFGRFHDVILLLLGFVLTTLVGGYLTQSWQARADEFQREAEHRRSEQQAASRVFEEVSRLMDRRLYRMRRLHNGLEGRARADEMAQRWDSYREVLFEWNENLNRNLALMQRYFGDGARDTFEFRINEGFRELGTLLEGGPYPEDGRSQYQVRQEKADSLNNVIYDFDVELISSIQTGEIGHFRSPG